MNAADTAAIQQVGAVGLRKRFFLYQQRSPRTGYIQRRFSVASFWYAQFAAFGSPFQAKSVIFKTSRTSSAPPRLRVRFSSAADTAAIQQVGAAVYVLKIFGGFRRKRSPIDNFANFADFA